MVINYALDVHFSYDCFQGLHSAYLHKDFFHLGKDLAFSWFRQEKRSYSLKKITKQCNSRWAITLDNVNRLYSKCRGFLNVRSLPKATMDLKFESRVKISTKCPLPHLKSATKCSLPHYRPTYIASFRMYKPCHPFLKNQIGFFV